MNPRALARQAPSGPLRLAARALLLVAAVARPAHAVGWDLGIAVGAHLFAGDGTLGAASSADAPQAMAEAGLGLSVRPIARLMLDVEALFSPTFARAGDHHGLPVLGYGAALRVLLATGATRPFVLVGGGGMTALAGAVRNGTVPDGALGVGCDLDLTRLLGLRVEARALGSPSLGPSSLAVDGDLRVALVVHLDQLGAATRKPLRARAIPVENSAPPPPPDRDGDGLPDAADRCPGQPGPVDNGGCPDTDADGDGVVDRLDRCPARPGPASGGGCPDGDGDLDGTLDRADRCPSRPGPAENGGCPDEDRDDDGVVDRLDRCPDAPETDNGWQDADGCPDALPDDLAPFVGVVDGLHFKAESVELSAESAPLLDALARALAAHPEVRIEIAAHTDSSGSAERNTRLSEKRAAAVRDFLVGKGVASTRLMALGFGPARPIADNATLEGRARNRRTELRLLPPLRR